MIKAIWKWIVSLFKKEKAPIDYKRMMEQLQTEARKQHLDKMTKARGGKKQKQTEVIFHNTKVLGTYKRQSQKSGRNEPCPCGSGLKSKKCCSA